MARKAKVYPGFVTVDNKEFRIVKVTKSQKAGRSEWHDDEDRTFEPFATFKGERVAVLKPV